MVKSKVEKQNVEFSTFTIRQGTVLHRIDSLYTVLLENVFVTTTKTKTKHLLTQIINKAMIHEYTAYKISKIE